MTVGEHLDELRGCLIRSLLALAVGCLICAYPVKWLLQFLVRPFVLVARRMGQPDSLLQTTPIEGFVIYIKVVLVAGLIVASPYVAGQIWSFVAAGLYQRERQLVKRMVWPSVALFLAGVVFMYVFALLFSLNFLIGFSGGLKMPDFRPTAWERRMLGLRSPPAPASRPASADVPEVPLLASDPADPPEGSVWFNLDEHKLKLRGTDRTYSLTFQRDDAHAMVTTHIRIADYLGFVLVLMIAFGLAFQMPLVVVFLVRTGIMPAATLRKYRKVVILLIVIVAGILAPPDLLSHLLLSGPMVLLFEIGLLIAGRGPRERSAPASGTPARPA